MSYRSADDILREYISDNGNPSVPINNPIVPTEIPPVSQSSFPATSMKVQSIEEANDLVWALNHDNMKLFDTSPNTMKARQILWPFRQKYYEEYMGGKVRPGEEWRAVFLNEVVGLQLLPVIAKWAGVVIVKTIAGFQLAGPAGAEAALVETLGEAVYDIAHEWGKNTGMHELVKSMNTEERAAYEETFATNRYSPEVAHLAFIEDEKNFKKRKEFLDKYGHPTQDAYEQRRRWKKPPVNTITGF